MVISLSKKNPNELRVIRMTLNMYQYQNRSEKQCEGEEFQTTQ